MVLWLEGGGEALCDGVVLQPLPQGPDGGWQRTQRTAGGGESGEFMFW